MTIAKHALFFAGLAALSYGAWLVYRPAGWIVGGLLLVAISFLFDRSSAK